MSLILVGGLLGISTEAWAPVQYVKICSLYGAGFYYIPGTDICTNPETGDTRTQTEGGTWRTILPYPEGKWVRNVKSACAPAKRVHVGTFKSTDFALNDYDRAQTPPVNLTLRPGQFISKVIMSGGFYNPKLPDARHGVNGNDGLCLRSMDPDVEELENPDGTTLVPAYGNDLRPIGCVANSRIVHMPAAYSISSTASYPSVDEFFYTADDDVSGPYLYGDQLVVTTDLRPGFRFLKYRDHSDDTDRFSAGALSVDVCIE